MLRFLLVAHFALLIGASGTTVGVTPHDSYSSSIGVLGCKVDTDRIAYWPSTPSCDEICVELSYKSRKLHLLKIDQSGGAYDISYDAWNTLYTGHSASDDPASGGAVDMEYKFVDPSHCKSLIRTDGHKLPLSASNSMNFLNSCLNPGDGRDDTWVGQHYILYNIQDSICTRGENEECTLESGQNQATCPHQLGLNAELKGQTVWNIMYPTGNKVKAGSPPPPPQPGQESDEGVGNSSGAVHWMHFAWVGLAVVLTTCQ